MLTIDTNEAGFGARAPSPAQVQRCPSPVHAVVVQLTCLMSRGVSIEECLTWLYSNVSIISCARYFINTHIHEAELLLGRSPFLSGFLDHFGSPRLPCLLTAPFMSLEPRLICLQNRALHVYIDIIFSVVHRATARMSL